MIGHALCVIGNVRYGKSLNEEKAALMGIYHDASEIITGDMPTPIKYYNKDMKDTFRKIEDEANRTLLNQLPDDMKPYFEKLFFKSEEYAYEWKLVKAADKISALIKCMEEEKTGNREFVKARETISATVDKMAEDLPEVGDFVRDFLGAYNKTLDELS